MAGLVLFKKGGRPVQQTKYIFVTGGVLSGLGKGITAAALGATLKARGYSVNIQKCDPYFNTDAGTLSPAEHGETFVTRDGAEADLDLGHYERFLDVELDRHSSCMSGRIYAQVIADERAGKYLGKTVQIIPHITNEMQRVILEAGRGYDFHIVEVGGTVGDYESTAWIEAVRQLRRKLDGGRTISVHVVYLPYLEASKELKSKPAQNAVRDLREAGIHPEVIVARSEHPVPPGIIEKLALFCDVDEAGVVAMPTAKSVYEVPLLLEEAGVADYVCAQLGLEPRRADLGQWQQLMEQISQPDLQPLRIGIVAKYLTNEDTYVSVMEAVKAAGWANGVRPELAWIDAEAVERPGGEALLAGYAGLIVPGGFGSRGVEGKVRAAAYAMEHGVPYLGLCLGMQVAVIAAARRAGLDGANTTEIDEATLHPVIHIMDDQRAVTAKGGTMRLGNYPCVLAPGSRAVVAYGATSITERHRHRYELNNEYRGRLVAGGLRLSGLSPDGRLVEIIELADHPFFVASQFHPEFKSRPYRPHPLFDALIAAAK
jgi:CTP synthase